MQATLECSPDGEVHAAPKMVWVEGGVRTTTQARQNTDSAMQLSLVESVCCPEKYCTPHVNPRGTAMLTGKVVQGVEGGAIRRRMQARRRGRV